MSIDQRAVIADPPARAGDWAESARSGAVLAVLLAVLFLPALVSAPDGGVLGWQYGDMGASYYPWRAWGFGWLSRGVVPFWNPHVFCGHPFAANFETALFYPPNLLFLVLPTSSAMNLCILAHLWLAGWGAWWLGRRLGLGRAAALLAGASWMLSGPLLGRVYAGHVTILCAMAWFPFLLLAAERIIERPDGRRVAAGAVVLGLSATAGHPQILFFSCFLVLVYTLHRLALIGRSGGARMASGRLVAMGAVALLGASLAAVPLLLTWHMQAGGARQQMTFADARTFNLPFGGWIGLLMPGFLGDGVSSPYWGPWYRWEISVYPGIPVLLLAACGMRGMGDSRGDGPFRALRLLLVLGFLLALGGIVHRLLYSLVPGFSFFRGPGKIMAHVTLALALIAGRGLDMVMDPRSRDARRVLVGWGAVLGIGSILLVVALRMQDAALYRRWIAAMAGGGSLLEVDPGRAVAAPYVAAVESRWWWELGRALALLLFTLGAVVLPFKAVSARTAVARGALLVVLATDLVMAGRGWVATLKPMAFALHSEVTRDENGRVFVADPALSPNGALLSGLYAANGYEPVYPRSFGDFMAVMHGRPREVFVPVHESWGRPEALVMMAVRAVLQPGGVEMPVPPSAARARLHTRWVGVPGAEDVWARLAGDVDPGVPVVDESSVEAAVVPSPAADAVTTTTLLAIEQDGPDRLSIDVPPGSRGLLVLADTWHPGWVAQAGGRDLPVHRVNGNFRGVFLSGDEGVVEFVYTPPGLMPGLVLTVAGLLALALMLARSRGDGGSRGSPPGRPPARRARA